MASQLSTKQCDREKYLSITQWLRVATEGDNPPDLRAVRGACEQVLRCWNNCPGAGRTDAQSMQEARCWQNRCPQHAGSKVLSV